MKIIDVKLDTVCGYTSPLPDFTEPEIAFAGRSNVGKSSLINAVMNRKRLARVGETPGKTRTINFYRIFAEIPDRDSEADTEEPRGLQSGPSATRKPRWKHDPARRKLSGEKEAGKRQGGEARVSGKPSAPSVRRPFFLVDLPGYGYANVSLDEKAKWGRMIERYLNSSGSLRQVFLLVDIRHEPNANDIQMYEWVTAGGFTPVIIATKADKIARGKVRAQTDLVRRALGAPEETVVIPASALTGQGTDEIRRVIENSLWYDSCESGSER